MIDAALLALLRCPESKQRLAPASPELLAQLKSKRSSGTLLNRAGTIVTQSVIEALVREDRHRCYLITGGIPILIESEGIDV